MLHQRVDQAGRRGLRQHAPGRCRRYRATTFAGSRSATSRARKPIWFSVAPPVDVAGTVIVAGAVGGGNAASTSGIGLTVHSASTSAGTSYSIHSAFAFAASSSSRLPSHRSSVTERTVELVRRPSPTAASPARPGAPSRLSRPAAGSDHYVGRHGSRSTCSRPSSGSGRCRHSGATGIGSHVWCHDYIVTYGIREGNPRDALFPRPDPTRPAPPPPPSPPTPRSSTPG